VDHETVLKLIIANSTGLEKASQDLIDCFNRLMVETQNQYAELAVFGEVIYLAKVQVMSQDNASLLLCQSSNLAILELTGTLTSETVTRISEGLEIFN
jgi:hypothetical protein